VVADDGGDDQGSGLTAADERDRGELERSPANVAAAHGGERPAGVSEEGERHLALGAKIVQIAGQWTLNRQLDVVDRARDLRLGVQSSREVVVQEE